MTDTWDGHERRAEDARFTKAMADVRELKLATTDLADAVKIKTDSLHEILRRMAGMFIGTLIVLTIMSLVMVNRVTDALHQGHEQIECQLSLTAEQKAALGDLACKE